jgi:hypothetical protein
VFVMTVSEILDDYEDKSIGEDSQFVISSLHCFI